MSRSASLTLNLLLSTMDVNGIPVGDATTPHMRIIDLAQVRQQTLPRCGGGFTMLTMLWPRRWRWSTLAPRAGS